MKKFLVLIVVLIVCGCGVRGEESHAGKRFYVRNVLEKYYVYENVMSDEDYRVFSSDNFEDANSVCNELNETQGFDKNR